ncbi:MULTISPECIES: adenosine deaminase [Marisediminitalea]|jgi:adenosine deaminase|uniref:adenosine deaminase n=1 Tax=Marisediminitalea TaxID=2662254 RepID=UPI0020CB6B1C|nr:adenosine deaminase [Marisediminitalea aggregata]MCP3862160.1 adenosine deaminase [Aestuariibacter sp.]MCP4232681.1 adenosine deaminase [Aestuariibacter sp.]MCP4527818.1 adenosine deaminase [Aestuariibacter sp.]MCP4949068.1 adenosine deaminase [Aestuariibacter sp.]MCP5010885.1 adenosine deaminase [Aestuariibacter sp.]|tara:strand:+ start:7310 stop:8305 length:996 start_codon:yes stop_codon:yes gene_type:complete
MQAFIEGMPKAELHVHIEGTLEPELSFALAEKNGIELPFDSPEALIAAYDFHDLPSFLTIYYAGMSVLIDESDFYKLTWDYLEKAASQNVVYTEIFFDPQGHTSRGVAFETVITGIRKAQVDAEQKLGIRSQLIMCFLRDMSAESAMEHLQMAKPYLGWLVGVGLDSDEYNNPPVKFKDVFALAKQWGLKLTMHCDVNQKNTLDHIRQVIEVIGVDRIDHGVNSLESDELCELIVEKQLGLTVCPVSNRFVVQSLTANEIRTMLDKGMLATINSDDPAYFRAYMNENLIELQQEGEFSQSELKTLMANAFKVTWLPEEDKAAYLAKLDAYQ